MRTHYTNWARRSDALRGAMMATRLSWAQCERLIDQRIAVGEVQKKKYGNARSSAVYYRMKK